MKNYPDRGESYVPTEAECRGGYAGARKQIAELRFLLIVSMLEPRRKLKYQITRF